MLVRDFQSTTYPDDLPADSRLFHQLLDGAIESYELEKRYIHKQGHVVWVQLNVSLVRDQQGQALHSISQIQDITERRNIQAAREEILGRLRLALKAGHLGTFRRNLVTGEGSWDEQTFALTCRPPSAGAPTLQDFLNMVHPDDRASVMAQMKATPERDGELSYRFRLVRGDGVLRHFITYAVAEPDSHGVQEWITGVFSDISDLVEVQERLKSSAQRLQLALSTSKLGVWRYDLKTRQTEWDDRMHEIYGIEKTALIPDRQRFMSLVLPDDREALESSWQQMLAGEADYRTRFRIRTPGGVLRQIEAHAIIQFDEAQRPIAVIGVNSDITEIVEATAESARLREQLQQAQKMETLGTLAAGVAHDFNNLLTGINGFVGLAASSLPPGHEAGDLLKQALRGAVNARDLVRRILDYSRGSADQAHALIELDALFREPAPLISAALPTNVSLSVTSSPDVAPVLADAGQLQQVLLNLCINGAHAIGSQPGTLTIELSTSRFAADANIPGGCSPGEYVCLSIRDTGCGMDEATRRRIFEPFFTTKKAGVGTGLGLSIVRDIVNAHRGGIELISAPGKGTTFLIYFPAAARVSPPKPLSPTKVAHRGKGQRILVVDDEPSIAMVLRLSLQKTGYAPETYTSAADAWKRFSQMPDDFELIMVDENMPDVKGTEFARRARQIRPFVPIVLMSGQLLVDGVSGVEAHAVHTLKKPFEIPDLLSVVGSSLDQSAVSAN
jgi:PAS domain S-box-containing protein